MNNDFDTWDKYCNYLWFDKKINIWLDISKISFNSTQIASLEKNFIDVFASIKELEAGAWKVIAEAREGGNVGIYRGSGEVRSDLIEEILTNISGIDVPRATKVIPITTSLIPNLDPS